MVSIALLIENMLTDTLPVLTLPGIIANWRICEHKEHEDSSQDRIKTAEGIPLYCATVAFLHTTVHLSMSCRI